MSSGPAQLGTCHEMILFGAWFPHTYSTCTHIYTHRRIPPHVCVRLKGTASMFLEKFSHKSSSHLVLQKFKEVVSHLPDRSYRTTESEILYRVIGIWHFWIVVVRFMLCLTKQSCSAISWWKEVEQLFSKTNLRRSVWAGEKSRSDSPRLFSPHVSRS